jgi:uncharacterized Zn finger protein
MASTIGYVQCPNCGQNDCYNDYNYKSGEDYTFCNECGYVHDLYIKRDDDDNSVVINGEIQFLKVIIDNPWGCYTFENQVGTIKSEEEFIKTFESYDKDRLQKGIISRYINGKIIKSSPYNILLNIKRNNVLNEIIK